MLIPPSSEAYAKIDSEAVERFNARYRGTNYELQVKRGANFGAGDICKARVLLLLANGGYDPTIDKLEPIDLSIPGWPLTWLSPDFRQASPRCISLVL